MAEEEGAQAPHSAHHSAQASLSDMR